MLEKGYGLTRKHAEKTAIILSLQKEMEERFGHMPVKEAIQKKWCDLKRHHPERIRERSAVLCPGTLLT